MASPPATPPAAVPDDPDDWRFGDVGGGDCEFAEYYRPGSFHPVSLGDTFNNGRYRVIRKLGDGSYSTVWLAVNPSTPRYVALKIMVAKASTTDTELSILAHLSQLAPGDPNSQHVTTLLDTFTHTGPNGTHRCMVFEPMGITAASLVEELPENKPKMHGVRQRYPYWMAKTILRHALRGLAFPHANGVVHGDVQPGNMLFAIDDIDSIPEDDLKWAPKHLYLKQSLHDRAVRPRRRLRAAAPPADTITPIGLRAPELILSETQRHAGPGIDIWAFGCLIYEFITGTPLFIVMMLSYAEEEQNDADDDHLTQMYDTIGALPEALMGSWPRKDRWFGPNGERLNPHRDVDGSVVEYVSGEALEERFAKEKPDAVGEEEAKVVCGLMRWALEYDPARRLGAAELLAHAWFEEG